MSDYFIIILFLILFCFLAIVLITKIDSPNIPYERSKGYCVLLGLFVIPLILSLAQTIVYWPVVNGYPVTLHQYRM